MIDMPERLEMLRYLTMVLDEERKQQPERLLMAEVRHDQEAGIVVQFRRPRRVEVLLPTAWLAGRNAVKELGMTLGGFKLAVLLRNLDDIPEDLPPAAVEARPAKPPSSDERDRGLEFALKWAPSVMPQTSKDIVAAADTFARYLAGEVPEQEDAHG